MEKLFLPLYILVALLFYIVMLPFVALRSLKPKYRDALPARFFLKNTPTFLPDGIWFHLCSLGEAKAIAPLVKQLPREQLRMSVITQTGYDTVKEYTEECRFLPFEPLLFSWMVPQRVLVVVEAELWYLLFVLAKQRGAKTILINARISDRSYGRYQHFRWFYRHIFSHVDYLYAQTERDRERFEALGAQHVEVAGSLKFAAIPKPRSMIVKPHGELICAASTHAKEENLVLEAFRERKRLQPSAKLVVAPRHPERFEVVDRLIRKYTVAEAWSYHRYSDRSNLESDILLLDTLGDLVDIYAVSDVVILGGAFEPHGGHNPAEAAQFGCKIISGEHHFNQNEMFSGIEGISVVASDKLRERLSQAELLPNTRIVKQMDIRPILNQIKRAHETSI